MVFLDSLPSYAYVLIIVGGALIIALIVFLLRKYVPGLKETDNKSNKSEKEIAEENLKHRLMQQEEKKQDEEEGNE